ncbi:TPA: hypothetical protein L5D12_002747 [Pseudomonas aeruginosa]|nr:hypothetical protein [Pseudomonas aeruginosa]UTN34065.1 hypothetical protein MMZ75_07645 [Pseudomonas aeruginosa]HBO8980218.1 hypothetical protein [Pseudomonas aeruginosa]HCL3876956.1 hypothetical protein [Pseudomonas aeruginosa]HEO1562240.1 hypothetical protein [Pseudomonas aeruginosa]
MTRPSDLESRSVFVLLNGVGFEAVFAVGMAALFAFQPLPTATLFLY